MDTISPKYVTLALLLTAACGQLSFNSNASADPTPKRATSPASSGASSDSGGSAHDRFVVQDLKIGLAVDGHAGFTCAKPTDVDPDRHCVKFVDPRCASQPANLGVLKYGEKAPLGCFLDYSSNATYLDSVLQQTPNTGDVTDKRPIKKPLMNLHLVGTRSTPSKIYRIRSMMAYDELTEDSKLYQAMVKKYGEPTYKNPPHDMRWKDDGTELRANCDRASCEIDVYDRNFEDAERRRQEETDAKARHQNAATPNL